jgi:hypothetical protein
MKFNRLIQNLLSTNQRARSGEGEATNEKHDRWIDYVVKAWKLWMHKQDKVNQKQPKPV